MTNTEGRQEVLGFFPFVHPKLIFQLFIDKHFAIVNSFVYPLLILSTRQ